MSPSSHRLSRREASPPLTVKRLSLYLRCLDGLAESGEKTISSQQLGRALGLTDAQVRKDLTCFGQFGRPGVGYDVHELAQQLRRIFGTDEPWDVGVIGAGRLGQALLGYKGFLPKGFRLAAAFDNDPAKIGRIIDAVRVQPINELAEAVRSGQFRLAILTVPTLAAQEVADDLCKAGILGILSFAPIPLTVPKGVAIVPVDLAVQLQQLSFYAAPARQRHRGGKAGGDGP